MRSSLPAASIARQKQMGSSLVYEHEVALHQHNLQRFVLAAAACSD